MGFHFLDCFRGLFKAANFSGGTFGVVGWQAMIQKLWVVCCIWKRVNVTRGSLSKGISTYKNKTNKKQLICHAGVNPQVKFHWRKTLEFWAIESPGWQICLTNMGNRKAPNPKKNTDTCTTVDAGNILKPESCDTPLMGATFKNRHVLCISKHRRCKSFGWGRSKSMKNIIEIQTLKSCAWKKLS